MILFPNIPLVKRSCAGERVKGSWVKGARTDTPFMGDVQPASGKVLELLPEGKRNTETITVFAPIELDFTTADAETQRSGDIIVWEERLYEVQIIKKWRSVLALDHWELAATRTKEGQK
jgi:hypothetical protein